MINNCNDGRCAFCRRGSLDLDVNFRSSCSNKQFQVQFDVTCKSCYCVYLINCKCCSMQYVGKTIESIRTRHNGHRGHMRAGTEAYVMRNHFLGEDGHGAENMVIKPIEICNKKTINKQEKHWISELNTVFPYGLNMDIKSKGIKNAYHHVITNRSDVNIYSMFNVVKKTDRVTKGSGCSNSSTHGTSNNFDPDNWIINTLGNSPNTDVVHTVRSEIFKLKNVHIKMLFVDVIRKLFNGDWITHISHPNIHYVIRDLCLFKLQKTYKKPSKAYVIVNYVNTLIDQVNLNRILNTNNIRLLFPVKPEYYSAPSISFSYSKTIRSSIVNYAETIADPNNDKFVCNCSNYPSKFKDAHHGHILTGDTSIVDHNELRSLLNKGLGYHEQQPPNKDKALVAIESGLDSYIHSVSKIMSTQINCFIPWKVEVMKQVKRKLASSKSYKYNNVLSKQNVKNELAKLKKDFVFIPIDKAAQNVCIICKKYYIEVISKEVEESDTFRMVSNDKNQKCRDIKRSYTGNCNLQDNLPTLYATAKMHKVPPKFRFITSARDTMFSNISIAISKGLQLLLNTAKSSFKYQIKELDNCIFIIDNRDKVVQFMDQSNQKQGKKSISTWDFSTLYTKIPHDKLKTKVAKFIRKMYNIVTDSKKAEIFITCSDKSKKAYFSKSRSNINISFSAEELIKHVRIIVDNSYIIFRNKVFRQIVGIPMGTNCAPFLANIFLHMYEYEYLQKLVDEGRIREAKHLAQTFRYQDDCISFNDNDMFYNHYQHIYPPEMQLENTNTSVAVCNFLDLRISIFRGKFKYKSYDKRRDFGFEICNYPNLTGNIPWRGSYGVFMSQIVRFCIINQSKNDFIKDIKVMTSKFLNQGFEKNMLKHVFLKFCIRYFYMWSKYGDILTSCAKLFD